MAIMLSCLEILIMSILVSIKYVYGKELVYPACGISDKFARIAGTKTLSPATMTIIMELGYEVNVKQTVIQSCMDRI